ncbi:hypothetical protein [Streptomyces sp. NPDC090025]
MRPAFGGADPGGHGADRRTLAVSLGVLLQETDHGWAIAHHQVSHLA